MKIEKIQNCLCHSKAYLKSHLGKHLVNLAANHTFSSLYIHLTIYSKNITSNTKNMLFRINYIQV